MNDIRASHHALISFQPHLQFWNAIFEEDNFIMVIILMVLFVIIIIIVIMITLMTGAIFSPTSSRTSRILFSTFSIAFWIITVQLLIGELLAKQSDRLKYHDHQPVWGWWESFCSCWPPCPRSGYSGHSRSAHSPAPENQTNWMIYRWQFCGEGTAPKYMIYIRFYVYSFLGI